MDAEEQNEFFGDEFRSISEDSLEAPIISENKNRPIFRNTFTSHKIMNEQVKEDISLLIPLYEGDTHRANIKIPRKTISSCNFGRRLYFNPFKVPNVNEENSDLNLDLHSVKGSSTNPSERSFTNITCFKKNHYEKSYLNMYQNRFNALKTPPKDTQRAICGDNSTRSVSTVVSEVQEFEDANDYASDSTSFYLEYVEECERNSKTESASNNNSVRNLCSSTINLKSASDSSMHFKSRKGNKYYKSTVKTNTDIPILGGLGPDINSIKDKIARLQKQQSYGLKASNKNRIKMMELNVLQNLKNEMEKSNENEQEILFCNGIM